MKATAQNIQGPAGNIRSTARGPVTPGAPAVDSPVVNRSHARRIAETNSPAPVAVDRTKPTPAGGTLIQQ